MFNHALGGGDRNFEADSPLNTLAGNLRRNNRSQVVLSESFCRAFPFSLSHPFISRLQQLEGAVVKLGRKCENRFSSCRSQREEMRASISVEVAKLEWRLATEWRVDIDYLSTIQ
jgi:hypothetical protein